MFRKIVYMLSAAGLAIVFGLPTFAAQSSGSIHVISGRRDNRVISGQVTLYRIGELTAESCRITDGLADWIVSRQEVMTEDFLHWALSQSWKNKWICDVSEEQGAEFHDLEEGLYLVVQTEAGPGYSVFAPFLVALPDEGNMDVTIPVGVSDISEIPRTGDHPAPIFMAMLLSLGIAVFIVLTENRKK